MDPSLNSYSNLENTLACRSVTGLAANGVSRQNSLWSDCRCADIALGSFADGTFDMSSIFPPLATGNAKADKALQDLGLTIVQVSQNQAAVCLDPQSRVFVVAEGGFVAAAVTGAYRILGLIDQTHLKEAVRDPYSKQILGHQQIGRLALLMNKGRFAIRN